MKGSSTRRFEMGLPYLAGLDLGLLFEAQAQMGKGDNQGLTTLISTLAAAGKLQIIRRISAISTATEVELKAAENNPQVMDDLVSLASDRLFVDAFKQTMAFAEELFLSLGVAQEKAPVKKGKTPATSPAVG